MREIKFRVWDEQHEEFKYWGFDVVDGIPGFYGISTGNDMSIDCCHQNSEQYTGLKDRLGHEIYEGDIVNVRRSSRVEPFEVKFSDGMFWAGYHTGSSTRTRKKALQPKYVEIIGNIHEETNS